MWKRFLCAVRGHVLRRTGIRWADHVVQRLRYPWVDTRISDKAVEMALRPERHLCQWLCDRCHQTFLGVYEPGDEWKPKWPPLQWERNLLIGSVGDLDSDDIVYDESIHETAAKYLPQARVVTRHVL